MITAPASHALDYAGARRPLAGAAPASTRPTAARALTQRWTVSVPFTIGHTRLCAWDGRAILVQPGEGLWAIGQDPSPESWPRWEADLSSVGPGWRSDPMIVARDGAVLRCHADGRVTPVDRRTHPGSELSAIGLPDHRALIKTYPARGSASFELYDTATRWTKSGAALHLLPHEHAIFWAHDRVVDCFDLDSGDRLWTAATPLRHIIGVVGSSLWIVPANAQLAAIDLITGRTTRTIAASNNRAVQGVLDDRGLFHSTTGLRYQMYDLSREGVLAADHALEGSSTAGGALAAVSEDGRLIVADDRGGLFVFDPAAPAPLTPVWRSGNPIAAPVIANGLLYALTQGTLACFG